MTVLAALGGRTDHEIGNLGLLARLGMGESLVFEGAEHRILAVDGRAVLQACPGEAWSFWTYDPAVCVTIAGVRWPVENSALDVGGHPSISNQATSEEVRIGTTGGAVIVYRQFKG
jgi:thiamine pyrophosphokinase